MTNAFGTRSNVHKKLCLMFQEASESSDEYCLLYWQIVYSIGLQFHVRLSGSILCNRSLVKVGCIWRIPSVYCCLLIRQPHNLKGPFILTQVKLIRFLLSVHVHNHHASCWALAFDHYEHHRWGFDSFFKKNFLYFVVNVYSTQI